MMRRTMARSRSTSFRAALGTALVVLFVATLAPASAATLGGLHADPIGSGSGTIRSITGVTLDWNLGADASEAPVTRHLRVTADPGERFSAGDMVEATVDTGEATCTARTAAAGDTDAVELVFPGCALLLPDAQTVALTITGTADRIRFDGTLGPVRGSLDAFAGAGAEARTGLALDADYAAVDGAPRLAQLAVEFEDTAPENLVGTRVYVALSPTDAPPVGPWHGGTVDTTGAVRAEASAGHGGAQSATIVTIDVRATSPEHAWEEAPAPDHFHVIVLRSQRLSDPLAGSAPAVLAGGGTVEHGGWIPPVADATEPVDLDTRLTYSEPNGPARTSDQTSLQYCYTFRVTNTSGEPVDWSVTFDTSLPPLWGLDPTGGDANDPAVGALTGLWGAETTSFDPETHLWTVAGDTAYNRTLPAATPENPAPSHEVRYCATPPIPAVDQTRYDKPLVSVDPQSSPYYVALRLSVTSDFRYLVPWEAQIDLADYVCASSLPAQLTAQNVVLTHLEGTRYRVRGTGPSGKRFVSADHPRDFVFASYSAGGKPFELGTCASPF